MTSSFYSPFTTPAAAAVAVIELSDPLGRVPTEDLNELFVTNAPSKSISRGVVNRPPTRFVTPRRNGSAFATTRMFDMSKFDRAPSQPSAASTTGTKSSGLFGPSPSCTTTQDAQQQQRSFSLASDSVMSTRSDGAPDQGTGSVFQSGGTVKPKLGAATSMFGSGFRSAQLVNHSKTATPPKADFGTGFPPYEPYKSYDVTLNPSGDLVTFHTICAMPVYAHKSPEEWHFEDYIKKEKGIPTLTTVKTTGSFPSADVPRNPFATHPATPSTTSGTGVFSFVSSSVPRTQASISAFSPSSLFGLFSASNASGDFGSPTAGGATATQGFGRTSDTAFGFSAESNASASLFGQATKSSAAPATTSPQFGETQESSSSTFSFGRSGSGGFSFGQSCDSSASSFRFGQSSSPGISFGGQSQESNNSGSLFEQSTSSGFSFGESCGSSISFEQNQEASTSGSLFGQPSSSVFAFGQQQTNGTNAPTLFGSSQNKSSSLGFQFGQFSGSPEPGFCVGGQAQGSGISSGFSFGGSNQGASNPGSLFGQSSGSGFSFGGQQQPEATSLFGSASGFEFGSSTGITETIAFSFGSATTNNAGDCASDDRNVQQQPTGFKFGSETGNVLASDSIGMSGRGGDAGSWSFGYSASSSSSSSSSSSNCENKNSSSTSDSVLVFGQQLSAASDSERKSAGSDTRN